MRFAATLCLAAVLPACAQDIRFPASFDSLAQKAEEVVDVTLDASMLQLAGKFLASEKSADAKVKNLVSGLQGIYVKSFQFHQPGEYSEADVQAIRSQLTAPEWSKIVNVRSQKSGEQAGVYLKRKGDQIVGMTIIAAEPTELTVVNIVGAIDPARLSELGGQFGVPRMQLDHGAKPK